MESKKQTKKKQWESTGKLDLLCYFLSLVPGCDCAVMKQVLTFEKKSAG